MATKAPAQIIATFLLRRVSAEGSGLEGTLSNISSQTYNRHHEDEDDEKRQPEGEGDVTSATGASFGGGIGLVLAQLKAPKAGRSKMCSANRVANSSVR